MKVSLVYGRVASLVEELGVSETRENRSLLLTMNYLSDCEGDTRRRDKADHLPKLDGRGFISRGQAFRLRPGSSPSVTVGAWNSVAVDGYAEVTLAAGVGDSLLEHWDLELLLELLLSVIVRREEAVLYLFF